MTDAPEVKEDPAPELKVVPIEDLDKIEKLLDVARNTVDMPNLPHIKAACMQELAEIDAAMGEQQALAQQEYEKALGEWSSKRNAKLRVEEEKRLAAEKKAKDERDAKGEVDSWTPPRDSLAQPIERRV